MTPDEIMERITAGTFTEWQKIADEYCRYDQQATEHEKQILAVTAEREKLLVELAQTDVDYKAHYTTVLQERNAAFDEATRATNQLKVISRNLAPLVVEWLTHYQAFTDEALTKDTREMKKNALELLRLMTPFTT